MAHHRHLVERGLAVEEDDVAVLEVPLDAEAVLEVAVGIAAHEAEVEALAVLADDEPNKEEGLNGRGFSSVSDKLFVGEKRKKTRGRRGKWEGTKEGRKRVKK